MSPSPRTKRYGGWNYRPTVYFQNKLFITHPPVSEMHLGSCEKGILLYLPRLAVCALRGIRHYGSGDEFIDS